MAPGESRSGQALAAHCGGAATRVNNGAFIDMAPSSIGANGDAAHR
jgi:hypothetical protein